MARKASFIQSDIEEKKLQEQFPARVRRITLTLDRNTYLKLRLLTEALAIEGLGEDVTHTRIAKRLFEQAVSEAYSELSPSVLSKARKRLLKAIEERHQANGGEE